MEVKEKLLDGGIGILPTDTLYGIVGKAELPMTVERIYEVRKRDLDKPFIVLIAFIDDLQKFNINIDADTRKILERVWPGKVSVVLPCPDERFEYLHRGTKTIAFRVPNKEDLHELLREVGPLVAPSANIQGFPPAETLEQAKRYFGDDVDFYVEGDLPDNVPSPLIKIENGKAIVLRGSMPLDLI